jgi:hypothetical protein
MAQHDYVIANGTGAAVRSDLNNALAAIVSQNSGATEPATMFAYQWWADTTTGLLKQRNAANNAWVTIGTLASTNLGLLASGGTLTSALGSASTPGITFTGDTNTGIYSPGADQVAVATGGTGRLFIDSSGRLGLGTSSPTDSLQVGPSTGTTGYSFFVTTPAVNAGSGSGFKVSGTYASTLSLVNVDAIGVNSGGYGSALAFRTTLETSGPVERMRIDSQGRVGIGTTSPSYTLDLSSSNDGRARQWIANTSFVGDNGNGTGFQIRPLGGSSQGLRFSDGGNSTEYARIDSSGRLLVGTSSTSTAAKLAVQGRTGGDPDGQGTVYVQRGGGSGSVISNQGIGIGDIYFADSAGNSCAAIAAASDGAWSNSNDFPGRLVFSTTADGASSPTERMRISNAGNFGFNTTTLSGKFNFDGSIFLFTQPSGAGTNALKFNTSTGAVTYDTSSRLIKENIEPCPYGLAEVKRLQPRKYFRTDDQREEVGFIADEVVGVLPEFVPLAKKSTLTHNEEDTEIIPIAVNYEKLTAVLTKALQEAVERIETLEAEVSALKGA